MQTKKTCAIAKKHKQDQGLLYFYLLPSFPKIRQLPQTESMKKSLITVKYVSMRE